MQTEDLDLQVQQQVIEDFKKIFNFFSNDGYLSLMIFLAHSGTVHCLSALISYNCMTYWVYVVRGGITRPILRLIMLGCKANQICLH